MKNILFKSLIINDQKTLKLLHISINVSFIFCLFGILIMYIHYKYFISFDLFKISTIIFHTGLLISTFSIMSALVINNYKENYI